MFRKSTVGFGFFPNRYSKVIAKLDRGEAKHLAVGFDAAFDISFQVICCGDSTRFQRAGKCAGQSTGECGDDVIDGGGKLRRWVYAIKPRIPSMHAKMQRLLESLDVRIAERPLLLNQSDFCRVNKFAHVYLPFMRF